MGEVDGGQCRGPERAAVQATAGEQETQHRADPVLDVRRALPDAVVVADHAQQPLQFAARGVLGRDAPVGVRRVGQVVERDRVRRETCVSLPQRLLEHFAHAREFRGRGFAADRRRGAHHLDAQHRVRHQRDDVGTQRQPGQVVEVLAAGLPVHAVDDLAQHGLRNVLDAREAVEDRVLAVPSLRAEHRSEAAVADHDGRGSVPDGLRQPGREFDLEVEVRVDVQQSRHQPAACRIDHAFRARAVEPGAARCDATPGDREILPAGRRTGAVEHQRVADQRLPAVSHGGRLAKTACRCARRSTVDRCLAAARACEPVASSDKWSRAAQRR